MSEAEHWDYLDKLITDSYRKEIEFEENVWRALPFFAAALGLQIAALVQLRVDAVALVGPAGWIAACLAAAWLASLVATIIFLARAIWAADFTYLGKETDFLTYLADLETAERARGGLATADPLPAGAGRRMREDLRQIVLRQLATCAVGNRSINKRRELARERAGRSTLASVVLALVFALFVITKPLYSFP
jgi:hypothetical protein